MFIILMTIYLFIDSFPSGVTMTEGLDIDMKGERFGIPLLQHAAKNSYRPNSVLEKLQEVRTRTCTTIEVLVLKPVY